MKEIKENLFSQNSKTTNMKRNKKDFTSCDEFH